MSTIPPIRREILVDADPAVAFEVFTDGLGDWWPLGEHSVHGAGGTVAFDGGQIVERSADGKTVVWGTVTRWEPPAAVAFTWHPGRAAERVSHVVVTFAAAPGPAGPGEAGTDEARTDETGTDEARTDETGTDEARTDEAGTDEAGTDETGTAQTLVKLEHAGWEAYDNPVAARTEYEHGWPVVLGQYQEHLGAGGETWVALLHRPGPAAPQNGSLVEDPRFRQHVAFLNRMAEAGYLVAAGPLGDADGEGMTILRLPGPGRLGTATRLATQDDASVAGGFFAVTVRPWQVMMRAQP